MHVSSSGKGSGHLTKHTLADALFVLLSCVQVQPGQVTRTSIHTLCAGCLLEAAGHARQLPVGACSSMKATHDLLLADAARL